MTIDISRTSPIRIYQDDYSERAEEPITASPSNVTPENRLGTAAQTYQEGVRELENVDSLLTLITNDTEAMRNLERRPSVSISIEGENQSVKGLPYPVAREKDLPLYQTILNKKLKPLALSCILDYVIRSTSTATNPWTVRWTVRLILSHTKSRDINRLLEDVRISEKCGQILKESAEIFVKKKKVVNACVFLMEERISHKYFQYLLSRDGTVTIKEYLNYDERVEVLYNLTNLDMENMQHMLQSLLQYYGYQCTVTYKKQTNHDVTPGTTMNIRMTILENVTPQLLNKGSWVEEIQREANRVECMKLRAQLREYEEKSNQIVMDAVARRVEAIEELLLCPITFETLDNPAITPNGHTYSRGALEKHLQRDQSDPMDRSRLRIEQVSVNRVAANFIEQFCELKKELQFQGTESMASE